MSSFNLLFTSSGRRFALIRHFKRVVKVLGIDESVVVTADLRKDAPTAFVGDYHEQVPRVTDERYVPALLEICKKYDIKLLVPLIDTELLLLSENIELFKRNGVVPLVCDPGVNKICRNKNNTAQFFDSIGIRTPKIYNADTVLADAGAAYPFLIKPFDGSCSIGVSKVATAEELKFFSETVKNPILQEFVDGEEYTVDAFVDFNGAVRCVVPRLRLETRAGEVSKGMTVKNSSIINATRVVAEKLPGAVGCLTIQCFLTKSGEIVFIEINPRFGGGFPLSIEAGADFPRWIVEILLGREPRIALDGWQDGVVMLRYDDAVFTTRDRI